MVSPLSILALGLPKPNITHYASGDQVELSLKRNRKIEKKNELNHLQVNLDRMLSEMDHMETTKAFSECISGYIVGLIGALLIALSTFSYIAGHLFGCIVFALPGFICWVAAYFVYKTIKNRKELFLSEVMEEKYEKLNALCMQAYALTV